MKIALISFWILARDIDYIRRAVRLPSLLDQLIDQLIDLVGNLILIPAFK
jgi:hypothetical protein